MQLPEEISSAWYADEEKGVFLVLVLWSNKIVSKVCVVDHRQVETVYNSRLFTSREDAVAANKEFVDDREQFCRMMIGLAEKRLRDRMEEYGHFMSIGDYDFAAKTLTAVANESNGLKPLVESLDAVAKYREAHKNSEAADGNA